MRCRISEDSTDNLIDGLKAFNWKYLFPEIQFQHPVLIEYVYCIKRTF